MNEPQTKRVKYVGPNKPWYDCPPHKAGHEGDLIIGMVAERHVRGALETEQESARLDKEHQDNHVMILWDGNTHAWACLCEDFEEC